ncbi:pentapeptide repeat-containing protein [Gloeobacter violaceus]|uniref:Glr1987 protein n=1 Tax=Gloeobacter violaceus (strain ATCC 29082 / PCC 7421) TaxID=251221 RepID=Q7NJ45_GLOVI|nr:pentapeptide repeat-containing protein [Gloeobacter violaceus]BAC89928.1 glr1987 [Gloeobacter violaceus PCC 7421]
MQHLPSAPARAAAFLELAPEERRRVLKALGLNRYSSFLVPMSSSEANIVCVSRFLRHPERVKFPDLRGVELSGLDLAEINWIRGDLSGADLRGCGLVRANLLFARLEDANLGGADLRGATLAETVWTGATVSGCRFGAGLGLGEAARRDLTARGGLFGLSDFG